MTEPVDPQSPPTPAAKPGGRRSVAAVLAEIRAAMAKNWLLSRIGRALRTCWRVVDTARRAAINGLFLLVVMVIAVATCSGGSAKIKEHTVLLIQPKGGLVEELGGDPAARLTSALMGGGDDEVLLRDLLDTLDHAAEDERIDVVLLAFSDFSGGGLTKLEDVAARIRHLRAQGKRVVAYADSYGQGAYYVAAHADEVYLHPMGVVGVEGLGSYGMYFKDAIDRLEIEWNVFRVGTFKSAVEPYLRNDMSDAAREAQLAWMNDLWGEYLDGVASARKIERSKIERFANHFDEALAETDGDAAQAALAYGLVDGVEPFDALRARLMEEVGTDRKKKTFRQVGARAYLREREAAAPWDNPRRDTVSIVVARGVIMDGKQGPGAIGGESTAKLIRKVREDDHVKAIVLRVDSPGGSAFASELIRRELELARVAGKPVVVSMGSVAASGGYWISTASDKIYASPATITGSIGIFGMLPTFERPLARHLGVHTDGVATGPMAGLTLTRALDPVAQRAIQRTIENGYQRFLRHVSESRDMSTEEVDAVAQGRVWSGAAALERGLVDELGGLDDAVKAAAALAELEEDDYRVDYAEPDLEFADRLARDLMKRNAELLQRVAWQGADPPRGVIAELEAAFRAQARILASFNDPHGMYAYEMIDVD